MNAPKFLASAAAAVTVVGAISFAYAQTTTDSPTGTPSNPTMRDGATTPSQSTPNNPGMQNRQRDGSTESMNRDSTGNTSRDSTGTMSNERMARADRN